MFAWDTLGVLLRRAENSTSSMPHVIATMAMMITSNRFRSCVGHSLAVRPASPEGNERNLDSCGMTLSFVFQYI